ncbi:MAG: 50S ribosomal protein L3 [Phycisphaerales bacterium]|jgi:large subunit ribosomal protein L3|nr:MAG: 50S ribosomal protein L3 [Planctomycetota bacterium]
MPIAILGKKIGMTRWFMEDGRNIPVTVIQAGPCVVTQVKTGKSDGYAAVQLAYDDSKPRATTQQLIGHDAKAGSTPKRVHQELRLEKDEEATAYELGQILSVDTFTGMKFVDVTGVSKGKGFQGTMVRWNFKGICASHGTERKHRSPGSIGSHGTDRGHGAKIKKGKKMSGRMGGERTTIRSLDLISVDVEKNLLVVKGAVPGASNGYLLIRTPKRLYKTKAVLQAAK